MDKAEDHSLIIFIIVIQIIMMNSSIKTLNKKYESLSETMQRLENENNKIEIEKKEDK